MRIAVVGTCASGKSTVVAALRQRGFDAFVVSQEHSIVHDLWNHQNPDVLVYLDVEYQTVQARRGTAWPRWIYDEQIERLHDARSRANVIVDTGTLSLDETVARIIEVVDPPASSEPR